MHKGLQGRRGRVTRETNHRLVLLGRDVKMGVTRVRAGIVSRGQPRRPISFGKCLDFSI